MPDQIPEMLKSQAEAALKKLDEARLHERCPKACKSCSQKHRKCQFKTGQYPKCDLCAKNNRECEILPPVIPYQRRPADTASVSSHSQQYDPYAGSPVSPHRSSPGEYGSGPLADSPSSGNALRSNPYSSGGPYQYTDSDAHSGSYPNSQNQHAPYSQYGGGQGHASQGRDQYYVPSQAHIHSSQPAYVPSSTHWPQARVQQVQASTQTYGYPGGMSPPTAARQTSSSTIPQIHTGQTYAGTAQGQGYPVASPASPSGSYAAVGNSMYHMPHQNTRYGAGTAQGYAQTLNTATGVANESGLYYQPNGHA